MAVRPEMWVAQPLRTGDKTPSNPVVMTADIWLLMEEVGGL